VKFVQVGPDEIFHRYLTPRWSFRPTSRAGAAISGGRFNRPGVTALYLSRAPQTALEEYRQGASIAPPATLAAYHVSVAQAVDLSDGYDPAHWSPDWADWDCLWRKIAWIDRQTPPSWLLGDALVSNGDAGLLFPSLRHAGGVNLVLFSDNFSAGDKVEVHDPDSRLPRDQSSWPEAARVRPVIRP
jgi:RES domain-containing protein